MSLEGDVKLDFGKRAPAPEDPGSRKESGLKESEQKFSGNSFGLMQDIQSALKEFNEEEQRKSKLASLQDTETAPKEPLAVRSRQVSESLQENLQLKPGCDSIQEVQEELEETPLRSQPPS